MECNTTPFIITNGKLVDGCGGDPIDDATLIAAAGTISFAGSTAAAPEPPANVRRIDAGGGTIMPGLVEAHYHPTY